MYQRVSSRKQKSAMKIENTVGRKLLKENSRF